MAPAGQAAHERERGERRRVLRSAARAGVTVYFRMFWYHRVHLRAFWYYTVYLRALNVVSRNDDEGGPLEQAVRDAGEARGGGTLAPESTWEGTLPESKYDVLVSSYGIY